MARKTRFREKRLYNLRILAVVLLAFLIVSGGLIAVDISKSYMLYGRAQLEMIKIKQLDKDMYQISILDNNFDLNLKYLKRDAARFKDIFNRGDFSSQGR